MNIRDIISIDRERGWALFFKRKEKAALNPEPVEIARQEALAALTQAENLAQSMLDNLNAGAPHGDQDAQGLRDAVSEAGDALERWIKLGGLA